MGNFESMPMLKYKRLIKDKQISKYLINKASVELQVFSKYLAVEQAQLLKYLDQTCQYTNKILVDYFGFTQFFT